MKKIILLYLLLLLSFSKTWGQSATVNTFNGLNSAILAANGFAGDYTITFSGDIIFDMSQTPIALPTWVRPINKPTGRLIILGANFKLEKSAGASAGRVLEILAGIVEINNLTITGGDGNNINGSGIINSGTLTLTNCVVRNNTLTGGIANGAGIYNTGFLVLRNSTVNNNVINSISSTFQGAGIYHNGSNLLMEYCTVSSNSFSPGGGSFQGAGLYLGNASFVFDNISVVNNTGATAGGGFFSALTGGTIRNSLFLGNLVGISTPDDINYNGGSGTAAAGSSNNLTEAIQATTIAPLFTTLNTMITPINQIIDLTLRNNGGVTQTHALLANNANIAIEGGLVLGYSQDQRGESFLGTLPDIGAYEFGTFWVTNVNNSGVGSFQAALSNVNFSFSGLPQSVLNTDTKRIKFNIPSPPSPTINLFFDPILSLPAIIDATTQTGYPTTRVKITRDTGNSGFGLRINAANSSIFGLTFGYGGSLSFNAGIRINANNITIGDITSPITGLNGKNVFQKCTSGISIASGSGTQVYNNYFGLNEDGTDGGITSNNGGYDLSIGDMATTVTNTTIGASGKGNIFAAKNGGITFVGNATLIRNTTIAFNKIGEDINRNIIAGSAVGIHTNGDVKILTISNNVIVNRDAAAGIFLNNNSKTVTIQNNQIGWQYNTANIPTARPCLYGIQIRGGGSSDTIKIQNNSIAGNYITLTAQGTGIYIENGTYAANAITINDNKIGLANDTIVPNGNGISAQGEGSIANYLNISNNYISGNISNGIVISQLGIPTSTIQPFTISANTIGLKSDLITPAPNNNNGIIITATIPLNTGIAITGNIIAKNTFTGITLGNIQGGSHNITGNFIGTNTIGTALGNGGAGIQISATCTGLTVGGTSLATANTISGNANGIVIDAADVTVQNNYIGTNAGGTSAVGNTGTGILINTHRNITIQNNIISGNSTGIATNISLPLALPPNIAIRSNRIGLGFDTALNDIAIPNTTGIDIGTGLSNITIGGVNSTDGNSFAATQTGILANSGCGIQNNTFGTNHAGTAALLGFTGFSAQAISLTSGSNNSTIDNNVICGASNNTPFTLGNLPTFTGTAEGILIDASNVMVQNNFIGITNSTAPDSIPNNFGITFKQGSTITSCNISNNVISNNKNVGIYAGCISSNTSPNIIQNNAFGMQDNLNLSTSNISAAPSQVGIALDRNTVTPFSANGFTITNNVINNTTKAAIILQSNQNTLTRNKIGVKGDGITAAGNLQAGILVGGAVLVGGANNNLIGSSTAGLENIIANNLTGIAILSTQPTTGNNNIIIQNFIKNNQQQGISVSGGFGNRIAQNSIYNNGTSPNFTEKGIDLNLALPVAQQGNNGQAAPTITSFNLNSPAVGQATIFVTYTGTGSYTFEFYHTEGTIVTNSNQVEGKTFLGTTTITNPTSFSFTFFTGTVTFNPSDYITATVTSPAPNTNTSEFSTPYLLCSTTITGITTQNIRTTCAGSLTDVRINLTTTTNISNLFDVDIDGNGNYEYLNIALQSDANGKFLLLRDVSGITFSNPKLYDQFANCTSAAFATPNPIIIQNSALPRPTIISARTVQSTSCTTPNGQLIVKIQNGVIGQNYELSTNGIFGAEYSVLFLGTDSTLRVTLGLTETVRDLQVYQAGNQCVSTTFPFSSQMIAPLQNIDSTRNVVVVIDEISPNFNTVVSLINAQDSISYRLFNRTLGKFVGIAQQGNNSTLNFNTDTLQQTGNYIYEIVATSIRTGCSRSLTKTVTVKVISGILAEELDILREVYTSTNGDFWTTKWDFTKDISTFLGVNVFGGRVTNILLPSNNLSGRLTTKVLNLRRLRTLNIGNNSLDFGSVEPFVNRTFAFNYKIQANINRQIDTTVYANTKMELAVITAGTQNRYQWTKDNVIIPNANFATLTFDALKLTDAGLYTCLITNTLGTELTLERRTIRLRVNSSTVSDLDLTLLIRINDELGGGNWTNKWDRSKPVAEWYGITMTGDKITSINLANNNLVGVIPNIIPLTTNILSDLTYLNLSGNRITGEIPKSLGNLSKLQYLDLSNNLLVGDVILELGKLQDLKNLLLSYNTFKAVHADLGKLIKLENLFLNNNNIAIIPAEIGNLKALQTLNFSNNLLKTIPTNLGLLTNLTTLGLANNQLTSVADIFNNLQSLQDLSLQNNELTALPASFIRLRNLKTLLLHTNFLDFADFELLATLPILNAAGAVYEPQAKVGTNQDILFTLDQALNLMQNVNGTANTFQWFKNGVAIGVSTNPLRTNAIYLADAGVYTLQIQNTIARKLTLVSYDIVVKVSCGNATSVRINTVGTSRYCEGETINTLLSADVNPDVQVVGYQWFRNNSRLNGENQKNLSIIQEGLYSLQVSDKNNCAFLSKPTAIQVLPKPRINVVQKGDTLTVNTTQSNGKLQYVWYKDNTQMLEAKTTSIVAKANGTYYVIVTDSTSCPTKSPIINLTVTGIEDDIAAELAKQITVYPNPTDAKITVILPENFAISKLKIYNMLGQVVLENLQKQIIDNIKNFDNKNNSLIINIENFVSGSYLLELQNEKGTVIRKKLVKQ
jgi:Leucine-rich repeat (LRR) protein